MVNCAAELLVAEENNLGIVAQSITIEVFDAETPTTMAKEQCKDCFLTGLSICADG